MAHLGRLGWLQVARRRVVRVLQTRIAATIRQLEVKVSESGPPDRRPEPHHLSQALHDLQAGGQMRVYRPQGDRSTDFFTLPEFYPDRTRERVQQLLLPYRLHRFLASYDDYCSIVLERIVRESFAARPEYRFLGRQPAKTPLDGVYELGAVRLGVEIKNIREWVYPMSGELWVMIRKCLEIDAVPLLVTRKTAYLTRRVCEELGIFTFQHHRQVFAAVVAGLLPDIQHVDRLGYKDVIASPVAPHPPLVTFLADRVPNLFGDHSARWNANAALLTEFAITRDLGSPKVSDAQRQAQYRAFMAALFPREEAETEDDEGDS